MITTEQHEKLRGWFAGRLPDELFDELGGGDGRPRGDHRHRPHRRAPSSPRAPRTPSRRRPSNGRIQEFRERTRDAPDRRGPRGRTPLPPKVSWGVECGGERALFTHVAAPVMTRLRQPERQVLDTLIAAGVARSRSDALAWCVRLVERHADDWLTELRDSLEQVQRVRAQGPDADDTEDGTAEPEDAPRDEQAES